MTSTDADSLAPLENSGNDIETIVVAVDSSNSGGRVIATAARLSRAVPAASIHIVHVFKSSRADHARVGTPAVPPDAIADAKEQLDAFLRSARRQCRNQIMGHFLIGDPADEILKVVDQTKADLLVVGTHDYKLFERLLLGSIAETLVRKAHCSTLVVRPPQHAHAQ
jgi:nucleotide-binding universal stress UspA family protein